MKTIHTLLSALAILTVAFACKPDPTTPSETSTEDLNAHIPAQDGFGVDYTSSSELTWVDMGTDHLWMNKNLSAAKSTDSGALEAFDSETVMFNDGDDYYIAYIPYKRAWMDIIEACSKEKSEDVGYMKWKTVDGIWGIVARSSKTGNAIFFPASGYIDGETTMDADGFHYWSGTMEAPAGHSGLITTCWSAGCIKGNPISLSLQEQTLKMSQRLVIPRPKTE